MGWLRRSGNGNSTMPLTPTNRDAMEEWENEGGSVPDVRGRELSHDGTRRLPLLPSGYHDLLGWGFQGVDGRVLYEFHRVYRPPQVLDHRGPISRLERTFCYWTATCERLDPSTKDRLAGRWINYAEAQARQVASLSFEHFSSGVEMRDELPVLLDLNNREA